LRVEEGHKPLGAVLRGRVSSRELQGGVDEESSTKPQEKSKEAKERSKVKWGGNEGRGRRARQEARTSPGKKEAECQNTS
jgi:hypothetical protein